MTLRTAAYDTKGISMRAGVVGLGRMGRALAARLLGEHNEVVVWNRSPGPVEVAVGLGARAATSLAELWDGTVAVCSFLSDDDALRSVVLGEAGLFAAAPHGAILVEMSTVSPSASAEVATAGAERGVAVLRCPVSGNPAVLQAGRLVLICSGDRGAFEAALPLLQAVGPVVHHVGTGEQARVLKLAINTMVAGTSQLLAEAIALCEAWGLERAAALDVIASSAVGSPFVGYKRQALVERDYSATFTTSMLGKDLGLARRAAEQVDLRLPVLDRVAELVEETCADGYADLDFTALLPHLQRQTGQVPDV